MSDSATPWIAACQASLFFTFSQSLLELMSIESMMLSNLRRRALFRVGPAGGVNLGGYLGILPIV